MGDLMSGSAWRDGFYQPALTVLERAGAPLPSGLGNTVAAKPQFP